MHPMLNIGIRAARAAGDLIVRNVDQISDLNISEKGLNDYVTEIDKRAEKIIIKTILTSYPDHSILAEESGSHGESDYQWIIDPLDGTTNFLHGIPHFAVSIACKYKDNIEQAIVYDPIKQELFTATRGNGAHLNNRRIRVSNRKYLKGALVGTGFPFGENSKLETFIHTLRAVFPIAAGIRRFGAASLDLAYVACGRLDGFWEFGLKEWDIAAGALLIQESGGIVSSIKNDATFLKTGDILAANSKLHDELFQLLSVTINQD
ncbi:MAG: myo-inositol-1(or 4)-monophosphatase [Gammaproteobacteria bacterium]|jgi:myo-inositol-1(or 4)-monophosphatase